MPSYFQTASAQNASNDPPFPVWLRHYLLHGAADGTRNKTLFSAARSFAGFNIPFAEAYQRLFARGTADGLPADEVKSAIESGYSYLPGQNTKAAGSAASAGNVHPSSPPQQSSASASIPLPAPIPGGFRILLETCFSPGENVAISETVTGQNGDRRPGPGDVLSRERWLERDVQSGINQIYPNPAGSFIRINPMKFGGKTDADVTSFRHCLIEFDLDQNGNRILKEVQYSALLNSGFPIAAVIDSGNKSIHAWTRMDAGTDRALYEARRDIVLKYFKAWHVDFNNQNPSRYSRCPEITRGAARQELLAINIGPASWDAWEQAQPAGASTSPRFTPGHSIAWCARQPINDCNTLLGNRYLCRTGGMFIVAPSGLGKSTLSIQMAVLWCCGLIAFGITPRKALRILIVQAEDDQGDCTEMSQVMNHLGLSDRQKKLVDENSELVRCNDLVSRNFIDALRAKLGEARQAGKPFDLVIINPYSVYLGADVKDDAACGQFLNEWFNPVLSDFDIAAILIHHTPKTNFQNTDRYKIWDWMYSGAGCAGITNWARAMLAIKPETENLEVFRFIAAKRGKRIDDWGGAFERYFAWSNIPDVLLWQDATAAQIAQATAAASHRKSTNLDIAIRQVPLLSPELKSEVIQKISSACGVGRDRAREALAQLIFEEKAFDYPIDNPAGKGRKLAGICRTRPLQP